ncbi:ASPARTIC PROTEINASE CDR1-RELATED [Salix viminalis]|uniref:ASPARTIC PROTEINASE CDR1-RELATED n=1 Tax=Salix viminalis TaxID=40686 RepID=A0A9Q0NSD9_SALVM|nr:ASPARTIC PROTEINASE CDR1-RELATED [Salix viminalis]
MADFQSPLSFPLAIALLFVSSFGCICAHRVGFTVDLIHRDSPLSPFYNSEETDLQRINNAFRRSISRVHHFDPAAAASVSPKAAESDVTSNRGEYLMSLSVGTPPFKIMGIADTGSDLIWTQCKPCEGCYKQVDPLFDPKSSKTYRDFSCDARKCRLLEQSSCSGNICQYQYSYGDQSYTMGNVASDTITLDSTASNPVSFPKTVIGCGHENGGTFSEKGSGIVGLGAGPLSLVSQMGSSVGGKFSYCLVPFSSRAGNSSKLNFGGSAVVSGPGVQSTPLLSSKTMSTFYVLTLEAMSVGNERIKFGGSSSGTGEGNIIIDSGTTLTIVPEDFFSDFSSAVGNQVHGQRAEDPSGSLSVCYSATSDLKVPAITAHFTGADVKLKSINTFIQVSDDVVCLAFAPTASGISIYGNVAQTNFLVGYNIQGKSLSFKPADCTKK